MGVNFGSHIFHRKFLQQFCTLFTFLQCWRVFSHRFHPNLHARTHTHTHLTFNFSQFYCRIPTRAAWEVNDFIDEIILSPNLSKKNCFQLDILGLPTVRITKQTGKLFDTIDSLGFSSVALQVIPQIQKSEQRTLAKYKFKTIDRSITKLIRFGFNNEP